MSFLIDPYRFNTCPADALAFIAAAGITDATQTQAICTLVSDLQTYGIWTKMKAIYPFVGGTASTHKWNLKDPRDLDAAYRLVFSGGITHSNTGALPNGTNAYADTKLNPSLILTGTNSHVSTYLRTNNDGVKCDIQSAELFATKIIGLYAKLSNNIYADIGNANISRIITSVSSSAGFSNITRTSSTVFKVFKNGSLLATNTNTDTAAMPNKNILLFATPETGSGIGQYSNRQCAFASIGDGLTDTEAANFYTAVQAYQTTLGRQV